MSKCVNCIHYDACKKISDVHGLAFGSSPFCDHYKDKSLFVELPCKVGDTVYCIEHKIIRECIVTMVKSINDTNQTRFIVEAECEIVSPFYSDGRKIKHGIMAVWEIEWGSWYRAFRTKEEAEKKLKEIEGNDRD